MKICFIIPFKYNWNSFSSTRATLETLQSEGYEVDLYIKKKSVIDYNSYDIIMLMGAGSKITREEFLKIKVPVFAFGLSDQNLFSKEHSYNCTHYFTNDLQTYRELSHRSDKPNYFYFPTSCDKRYHKNLDLEKTTDILVYGVGNHKFVPNRNEVVNKLREAHFNVKVFGRGWDTHSDTRNFIEGQKLVEEINKAKIVLDLSNEITALPRRIFEASACGTLVVSFDREDTRQLFTKNIEIVLYSDFDDLIFELDFHLYHNMITRGMAKKAQARCYKDHDISVRIKILTKIIEGLK